MTIAVALILYALAFAGGIGYELIAERRENKLLGGKHGIQI